MTPEAQRIAIAKKMGTHTVEVGQRPGLNIRIYRLTDKNGKKGDFWDGGSSTDTGFRFPANYLADLNAMHEAEEVLNEKQQQVFLYQLHGERVTSNNWLLVHANAPQRCEAFLRTLGLWEASK